MYLFIYLFFEGSLLIISCIQYKCNTYVDVNEIPVCIKKKLLYVYACSTCLLHFCLNTALWYCYEFHSCISHLKIYVFEVYGNFLMPSIQLMKYD